MKLISRKNRNQQIIAKDQKRMICKAITMIFNKIPVMKKSGVLRMIYKLIPDGLILACITLYPINGFPNFD